MNDLEQVGTLYNYICRQSKDSSTGVLISSLRKKFKLRTRDMIVFIRCLMEYSNYFIEDECISCQVYYGKDCYDIYAEELDIDEIENVNLDKYHILVFDTVYLLKEKIHLEKVEIKNARLIQELAGELMASWEKISDDHVNHKFFLDKNLQRKKQEKKAVEKRIWTSSLIQERIVQLGIKEKNEKKFHISEVRPTGMYYNIFLDDYIFVYQSMTDEELLEIPMEKLQNIEATKKSYHSLDGFRIDDYIRQRQVYDMTVRVYPEGNVKQKLKNLLENNQLSIVSGEEYDLFKFKTMNPMQFRNLFHSYGRTVIVESPESLRIEMVSMLRKLYKSYTGD